MGCPRDIDPGCLEFLEERFAQFHEGGDTVDLRAAMAEHRKLYFFDDDLFLQQCPKNTLNMLPYSLVAP